jgi:hypothetical protein
MTALEARRSDLLDQLKAARPPIPRLHPNVAAYTEKKSSAYARPLMPKVPAQRLANASAGS